MTKTTRLVNGAAVDDGRTVEGYDVIGDLHGHLRALEGLLADMGYTCTDGVWSHPSRVAVFVGDLVDRGAQQVGLVQTVMRMVQAGTALVTIGNHEYNAVAWNTPFVCPPESTDPRPHRDYCRNHDQKNHGQHKAFLDQVGEGSPTHEEFVEWFSSLPLWLDLQLGEARLRVVHACWHEESMDVLRGLMPDGHLTTDAVVATSVKYSPEYEALEVVLKGPEVDMGDFWYVDHGGTPRHKARLRWWDTSATTLDKLALVPRNAKTPQGDPFPPLPATPVHDVPRYTGDVPVIVGHYWEKVPVALYNEKVASTDYSLAKDGPAVAYRWGGEQVLTPDNYFVHWVGHPDSGDVRDPGSFGDDSAG
ncbi:MAG: metallophosphoesterase [Acidobacteria bacterium]|nr:metallophosphoesterase [Acidobacteriota bacterium]